MISSPCYSPILHSSPNPNLSRSLTSHLSLPIPATIRCHDSFHRISAAAARTSREVTQPPPAVPRDSLYEFLGISLGASHDEIKAAYRRLARIWHPDVAVTGEKTGSSVYGADEFIRIHAAYSTLSDPDKRDAYDRKLARWRIRPFGAFNGVSASATSSFCKYPSRNWETDQCW